MYIYPTSVLSINKLSYLLTLHPFSPQSIIPINIKHSYTYFHPFLFGPILHTVRTNFILIFTLKVLFSLFLGKGSFFSLYPFKITYIHTSLFQYSLYKKQTTFFLPIIIRCILLKNKRYYWR
jgi:hypothetical protein